MSTTRTKGELEVDEVRGVIYFHAETGGITILRIYGLPVPMPKLNAKPLKLQMYDVCLPPPAGVNWVPR